MMNKINLGELTLENVGQWPIHVKIGVLLGVSILIVGMGYSFIIKANFDQFETLQENEIKLKIDFESKQHQSVSLNSKVFLCLKS